MKLGLGTVQFGTDYGISNQLGQTTPAEVGRILEFAASNGISYLDTAPAYGNSELVLGKIFEPIHPFRIITKTQKIGKSQITADDVRFSLDVFRKSLDLLQQRSVYGLLVHHHDDLLNEGGERLMAGLESLKERKLVEKIGVSVYNRQDIDRILAKYSIDLIQIPLNVFDQRLLEDAYLQDLKSKGIEIHVRSVFLQGILLMSEIELPDYLAGLAPYLHRYHQENKKLGISSLQAAIGFVDRLAEVDTILVGVNNLHQLTEIVNALICKFDTSYLQEFAIKNEALINPVLWRSKL
jgi:aryl-alcohol dehydrogenase-like predicted oxidoreductase